MFKIGITAGLVLSLAAPQLAIAKQGDDTSKSSEELKCKYQKVLGSKIPQKVCKTQEAWLQLEREQIESQRTDRVRNRNSGGN